MPVWFLDDSLWFPPVEEAMPDGLLAASGDLRPERLLLAYRSGIFPWFGEEEIPLWWSPDPRFVLFPEDLKVSRSMQRIINRGEFEFKVDTAFEEVIGNCSAIIRKGMDGTWITEEMITAYTQLHQLGFAHSAEAWQDGNLVGGLYGVRLGSIFFGESMFSKVSNASKFAFINMVKLLQAQGVQLIDCQVHTTHLESLGAKMISRKRFMKILKHGIQNA
jgi:leucyl/phenylalanyl-tRNA---protein transferase